MAEGTILSSETVCIKEHPNIPEYDFEPNDPKPVVYWDKKTGKVHVSMPL